MKRFQVVTQLEYSNFLSLLNCASTDLTHLGYVSYAPSLSLIRTLRAFTLINNRITRLFLSCVVFFQLKGKVPMFCVCAPVNQRPTSLSSLLFYHIKLLHVFFISFILSRWLHHYLFNYFATAFSQFLFSFSFKIGMN